jgi:hypothetical protein
MKNNEFLRFCIIVRQQIVGVPILDKSRKNGINIQNFIMSLIFEKWRNFLLQIEYKPFIFISIENHSLLDF